VLGINGKKESVRFRVHITCAYILCLSFSLFKKWTATDGVKAEGR